MPHNERQMRRMVAVIESFLTDGVKEAVRITRRRLVKATPKRTQFAAHWQIGIGGPPEMVPADKPSQTIYPLLGDSDTDADLAGYTLGDDIIMMSPATYIVYLNAGTSPQADANFIQDELAEATRDLQSWRWEGTVTA